MERGRRGTFSPEWGRAHNRLRKIPWDLEAEFRAQHAVQTFFVRAIPDINRWNANSGYAEYGFLLAKSTRAGAVYVSSPPNDPIITIENWETPRELTASPLARIKEVAI